MIVRIVEVLFPELLIKLSPSLGAKKKRNIWFSVVLLKFIMRKFMTYLEKIQRLGWI
jgi:hypothetical protein